MKNNIRISVIICTHNRAKYLRRTLDAAMKQTLPPDNYEVIVIDNCSTDNTVQVVKEKSELCTQGHLRYVYEASLGLNHARNRGIVESSAEYIAYLDDDAIAAPDWLAELLGGFTKLVPKPVCIGGKVVLDWEGDEPSWCVGSFRSLFTCVDHGEHVLHLNAAPPTNRWLVGANMAFDRMYLLANSLTFSSKLGRKGNNLLSGEDTAIINHLLKMNQPVFYLPQSTVYHMVVPERRSIRYFLRRLIADGRTQPYIEVAEGRISSNYAGLLYRSQYDMRMCLLYCGKAFYHGLLQRKTKAYDSFYTSLRYLGRVMTLLSWLVTRDRTVAT